jgi:hypothetical protein
MGTEQGKQVGIALKAVLEMQSDCIKLIEDLDKFMTGYRSVYGNIVTLDLGSTIGRKTYVAEGLIRLYARPKEHANVLCINICFFDRNDPKFVEPILVAANIIYESIPPDQSESPRRCWDAWHAFLDWAPERVFDQPITLTQPPKRPTIETVTVAAMPLFGIKNIDDVKRLVELVGRP